MWRSDDSGASWYPLADFMGNLSVCSLAFDPSNPNRIYAGTGEGFGNINAIRGVLTAWRLAVDFGRASHASLD